MTPDRWTHIRRIFEGALERPAQDRAAYLRVVCARDDDLRREVESLLASHDSSADFLAQPAAQLGPLLVAHDVARDEDSDEYPQNYRLGPYQFERRIGRGGMGSVWLATRFDHEYRKQVAIKMVKRGMDSQEILRRFRMERQVLANLDHANIAGLIDGGSTPEGLPYLVMEYVEGTPIDQYCGRNKSTVTQRLNLFRAVCSAVQYAHQNLIVHRDIKTGNILVTSDGVPKLLDFGIAKLLRSDSSTLDLSQTRPEMRPMTLDYASPEQVRGEPITTATDVYSLGVLLYKILTGKMPYGVAMRSQAALQHAICEIDPIRPSAVILSDRQATIPEATQKIEAAVETRDKARKRLRKKLAGDLDTIILKALRKEPHRRYVSAEQFSEDIRRYLEGRPVIARIDTPGYRMTKFVRRNAVAVAAVLLTAVVLIGVAAFEVRNAGLATEARIDTMRQDDQVRRELLHTASALGGVQLAAGDSTAAFASYRRALEVAEALFASETAGGNPAAADTRLALAEGNAHMGEILLQSGAPATALARLEKARNLYRQLLSSDRGNSAIQRALADLEPYLTSARSR